VWTWYYLGSIDKLYNQQHPSSRHPREALRAERKRIISQLGEEQSMVAERVERTAAGVWYVREARFSRQAQPWRVRIRLDTMGYLHDIVVEPAASEPAPSRFESYADKVHLRLPFEGIWHVTNAGRTVKDNPHAAERDRRFAVDFDVQDRGKQHDGRGDILDQFYCWDRAVLAPAAGVVLEVVDGVADHPPGAFTAETLGNFVVLDHGGGERSVLANLEKGSPSVKKGAHVAAGASIGKCGNSGGQPFPHVHFHMQNDATPPEGLPAQFEGYMADGEDVARGEPARGQFVSAVK
jgi:hypothetical protein